MKRSIVTELIIIALLSASSFSFGQVNLLDAFEDFAKRFQGSASEFTFIDSKYYLRTPTVGIVQISWLDTNRVLFIGYPENDRQKLEKDIHNYRKQFGLYVWNAQANTVTFHDKATGNPCVYGDFVRYTSRSDLENYIHIYKAGKFGEEKEISFDVGKKYAQDRAGIRSVFNRFTCQTYEPNQIRLIADHYSYALIDGHGYLDLSGERVRLFKPNTLEPIILPIMKGHLQVSGISYSRWANAYLLFGLPPAVKSLKPPFNRPKGVADVVYLLSPDGNVQKLEFPYGPWLEGTLMEDFRGYVLTRAGLVFWTRFGGDSSSTAGAYLSVGKRVVKLSDGYPIAIGVSPDGCRLAIALGKVGSSPLKMIVLCK